MGKKKKQKLLTSDFYRSLDKLRTANGVMAISKIDGGSTLMYELSERNELGFKFPTLTDMNDCLKYGQINPEFARVMSGDLCEDDFTNETQSRRTAEHPCRS